MKIWEISLGLVFAMLLAGDTALAEEETLDRPLIRRLKGYGYIYNPSCRDRSQVIPGCFRRTGWQRCRYPEILPPGQDTPLPICPLSKEAAVTQGSVSVKSGDDGSKREKRGFGSKLRRRLKKFGKQIENVGKKIRLYYSRQKGFNAEVTG